GLERKPHLLARLLLLSGARQGKSALDRVPELGEGALQILLLVRRPAGRSKLLFALERVLQVTAHTLELRLPRSQGISLARIGGVDVEHVAHGHADRIQFILNAQEL